MNISYLFLAPGFEETEALATVDTLRRAEINVQTVAVTSGPSTEVTGAHGITVKADTGIDSIELTDNVLWLICPGGMPGATNLAKSAKLCKMLKAHNDRHGKIAAICASPAVVLSPLGILAGHRATCYPGFESIVSTETEMTGRPVEVSGNVITSSGPANTFAFALAIVTETDGADKAGTVAQAMLLQA